jgi:hypothetical protein
MSRLTPLPRPGWIAALSFIGLMVIAGIVTVAKSMHVVDDTLARRAIGVILGVMLVVVGNFLPKMRPLNWPGVDPAETSAAERMAGWMLVLAGVAYSGWFLFAPLKLARPAASFVGIAALVMIAVNWVWWARRARRRDPGVSAEAATPSRQAVEKRTLMIWLLFAFLYVFATACVVYLINDRHRTLAIASWMHVGFWAIFAVLTVVLSFGPGSRGSADGPRDMPGSGS